MHRERSTPGLREAQTSRFPHSGLPTPAMADDTRSTAHPDAGLSTTAEPAPPCPAPSSDMSGWRDVTVQADGDLHLSLRMSPGLRSPRRGQTEEARRFSGRAYSLGWWSEPTSPAHFVALWVSERPGFPTGAYSPDSEPKQHGWDTCTEQIDGREVSIASWLTTTADGPPIYSVAAHWPLRPGVWIELAADAPTRRAQEDCLAMLRTLRVESRSPARDAPEWLQDAQAVAANGGGGSATADASSAPAMLPASPSSQLPDAGRVAAPATESDVAYASARLRALPGVLAAEIEWDPEGGVTDIHLLVTKEAEPRATLRAAERVLDDELGPSLEDRKISLVQTVATSEELGRQMPASPSGDTGRTTREGPGRLPTVGVPIAERPRRVLFEDLEMKRTRASGEKYRVTLKLDGVPLMGEAAGAVIEGQRLAAVARATLAALSSAPDLPKASGLGLEGATIVEMFGRTLVLVALTAQRGREVVLLSGSAEVKDDRETATALAVLDATNRWLD